MTDLSFHNRDSVQPIAQSILDALEGISYLVNDEGVIIAYGRPAWDRSAAENGEADSLCAKNVLGRKLSDFISGNEVRDSYAALTSSLRAAPQTKVILPCRCDSPTEQRELRLSISTLIMEGRFLGWLYVSTLVSAHTRPHLSLFDFDLMASRAKAQSALPVLSMCSYCQRVFDTLEDQGEWIEATEYYRRGRSELVQISHGICERCEIDIVEPLTIGLRECQQRNPKDQ